MHKNNALLGGAALGALIALTAGTGVDAKAVRRHEKNAAATSDASVRSEIAELRAQLDALKTSTQQEAAGQADSQAQIAQLRQQLSEAQAQVATQQAKLDEQIQTIPGAVNTAVAAAAPKTDKLYIKGVTLQFGGFVAAESVFRTRGETADIASSFGGIPFPNNVPGRLNEFRMTARQSRITGLVEGRVNPQLLLSAYAEADFLGGAQTANSNETNSYNPRMRVFYTTADYETAFGGVHMLAGQNWSLATLNSKGISPRNEVPPATIDAQYVPGFVFTRQPQVRATVDINNSLWFAVSVENPQTTYFNSGKFLPGDGVFTNAPAGPGFSSVNSLSINKYPDTIAKAAYEHDLGGGHQLHAEAFGILRDFYYRENQGAGRSNNDVAGGGFGGGVTFALFPHLLDLQASGIVGRGIGRYGASQLPDATFGPDGSLHPIRETMFLAGGTLHLGKSFDIYAYGGEEREQRTAYSAGTVFNGYGNPSYDNTGCETEGASNCSGNNRLVEQITGGFWDRPYVGKWGKFQVGMQYSYTERHAFTGVGTAGAAGNASPVARDNMILTSIRYYPF